MTVPTTTNKVVYAGDGVTTLWPFSFVVVLASDLQVYVTDTLGNISLISSSLYSVDLTNARVTYPLSGSPLASGMKITLRRVVSLDQSTDWKNQGPFNAEVLEASIDKLTMECQQLSESLARAVQYGVDQTPSDTTTATIISTLNAAVAALSGLTQNSYLLPSANSPQTNKCAVAAGKFQKSDGTSVITFVGGQSPVFGVVSVNPRIDLLCIDDTNGLSVVTGTEAASPVPPLYPASKTVIAEITITETSNVLISTADIKDVRPFLEGTFAQSYVDAILWKAPVKAATTAALAANTYANGTSGYGATLTANANGALAAQDGITLLAGDRLLVKDEAAGANKGIYVVTQVGDASHPYILTRALDSCVPAALAAGMRTYVQTGTVNAGVVYIQTTTGAIVIGTTALVFSANQQMATAILKGLGAGAVAGDSVRYEQVSSIWGYRRPVMLWIDANTVDVENNTGNSNETKIIFSDGEVRTVTENTATTDKYRRFIITATANYTSGTEDSGLRSGLSRTANTWYALYAVKSLIDATKFVLVGDTNFPTQSNFATLNSQYGTNSWVYLGPVANGDNAGHTNTIPSFCQVGTKITFTNDVTINATTQCGILIASAAAGNFFLTAAPTAGTNIAGPCVPPTVFSGVVTLTIVSGANVGYDLTVGSGARIPVSGLTVGSTTMSMSANVQFRNIDGGSHSMQWHNGTTGYAKQVVLAVMDDLALASPFGQLVAG